MLFLLLLPFYFQSAQWACAERMWMYHFNRNIPMHVYMVKDLGFKRNNSGVLFGFSILGIWAYSGILLPMFTCPHATGLLRTFWIRKGYWLHVNPLNVWFLFQDDMCEESVSMGWGTFPGWSKLNTCLQINLRVTLTLRLWIVWSSGTESKFFSRRLSQ